MPNVQQHDWLRLKRTNEMKRWEYKIVPIENASGSGKIAADRRVWQAQLNKLGIAGWEFMKDMDGCIFLKRPREEP